MTGPTTPPAESPMAARTHPLIAWSSLTGDNGTAAATAGSSAHPTLRRIPTALSENLAALDSPLTAIERALQNFGRAGIESPAESGAGASAAVAAFAQRHVHRYRHILWLNARIPACMRCELGDAAYTLRVDAGTSGRLPRMIEAAVNALNTSGPILVVVDQPGDNSWMDHVPASAHCIAVHAAELPDGFTSMPWPLWEADHIAAMFSAHGVTLRANDAQQLRSALGGNPLAARLAAAYARSAAVAPATLIDLLRRIPSPESGGSNVAPIERALRVALPSALAKAPAAIEFLGLCAFFGPEPIPLHLFRDSAAFVSSRLGAIVQNAESTHKLLGWLVRHGFAAADRENVVVHSAVSRVVREALSSAHRRYLSIAALRLLARAFPIEESYGHPLPLCTRLLPHLLDALHHSAQLEKPIEETGRMYNQVGQYLRMCHELDAAETCYAMAVAMARRTRRAKHPALALRLNNLAVIQQERGDAAGARASFQEALDVSRSRYGGTHPMLLAQARNLGNFLESNKDWAEARPLYEDMVTRYAENYGWNDPITAEFVHRLGNVNQGLGEYERARNCFEQALKAARLSEHAAMRALLPILLVDYAAILLHFDEEEAAETIVQEAEARLTPSLEADRPTFIRALTRVGDVYRARNNWPRARQCYEEALQTAVKSGGSNDVERAMLAARAGRAAAKEGAYETAQRWLNESLAYTREAHGDDSEPMAACLINLGRAHEDAGEFENALACFEIATGLFEKHKGPRHPATAAAFRRRGRALEGLHRYPEALQHYQRALAIHSASNEPDPLAAARDAQNVGTVLLRLHNPAAALGYLHQALATFESRLGPNHARSVMVHNLIEDVNGHGA